MKINEAKLAQLGVGADVVQELYLSKGFTLPLQTRLELAARGVTVLEKLPNTFELVTAAAAPKAPAATAPAPKK